MLISQAFAQGMEGVAGAPPAPSPLWNFGLLIVMVVLFYVLLIMPQQKRFKEHSKMLSALEKGDKVITGGGLVAKVEKIVDDKEVLLNLGGGMQVTALRSTIAGKADETSAVLKEEKPAKKSAAKKEPATKAASAKTATKKAPAKKAPAKKTTAKKKASA